MKNILLRYEIFERFCLVNLENIFKRFRISRFFYFVSENIPKITKNIKNIMSAPRWRCGAIFFLAIFENAQIWSFPIKICFQIFDHVLIIKNKKKTPHPKQKVHFNPKLDFFRQKILKKKRSKKKSLNYHQKAFPYKYIFQKHTFFSKPFYGAHQKKNKKYIFSKSLILDLS